jgi:outer membrane receptor protein involved in Fe transport
MNRFLATFLSLLIACGLASEAFSASTGKISGKVVDTNGDPLPGTNVVIVGTTQGASTDGNGDYFILNVTPGTYTLQVSMVGYTTVTQSGVRVNIDLTTPVNFSGQFAMAEEALGLDEITVIAERPVVQADISANVQNLTEQEIETLPITSITEAVELQAGVLTNLYGDLSIRGSDLSEIAYTVDGLSMRDGRDNTPMSTVSVTAIQDVKVQTGGFNAEYGNVRSGLVNIVTKEGRKDRYSFDAFLRYSPPQEEFFGPHPNDMNDPGYLLKPFIDPKVAFTGTHTPESGWDIYSRRNFPEATGWSNFALDLIAQPSNPYYGVGIVDDPNVDESTLDPSELKVNNGLLDVMLFYFRKDFSIEPSKHDIDMSLGGPLLPPMMGADLGGLRFFGSVKRERRPYLSYFLINSYMNDFWRMKVTSDVRTNIKASVEFLINRESGLQQNENGFPQIFRGNGALATVDDHPEDRIGGGYYEPLYSDSFFGVSDRERINVGFRMTHVLSPKTFYEFRVQRMHSAFDLQIPPERDLQTVVKRFPRNPDFPAPEPIQQVVEVTQNEIGLAETPFGWGLRNESYNRMEFGSGWAQAQDSSKVTVWTTKIDITSQRNQVAQFKAGFEYIFSQYRIGHGHFEFRRANKTPGYDWDRDPAQIAAYVQTKLEFNAMIANLGLRLDHWNGRGDWWVYDDWASAFGAKFGEAELPNVLEQAPIKKQTFISPRLGVSFPMTADSKLFFNYGHFRQMLDARNLFSIFSSDSFAITEMGNPNHPMPRSINYELGFEQNLFDRYLLRLSGYYKANDEQPNLVSYTNLDQSVAYAFSEPLNYDDIRGFELTIRKRRGKWVGGFVNYTFMQTKDGNFGFGSRFENRLSQAQFIRDTRFHYQNKPVSRPFGSAALEFYTPRDYGTKVAGFHPLGNWEAAFLVNWRAGQHEDWFGPEEVSLSGVSNNVQWRDFWNWDLRLTKRFGNLATLYIDVENLFNQKRLNPGSFGGQGSFGDRDLYMASLHLDPDKAFEGLTDAEIPYAFPPGDDRPGDFRTDDRFVPIEIVGKAADLPADGLPGTAEITPGLPTGLEPDRRLLWYVADSDTYQEYRNGSWGVADPGFLKEVLDKKLYIDMPNERMGRFLFPRRVFFGLRFSL